MSACPNDQVGTNGQAGAVSQNGCAVLPHECAPTFQLELGFQSYAVGDLTQYGFRIDGALPEEDSDHIFQGQLQADGMAPLEIEFRVRKRDEESAKCTFYNLRLEQKTSLLRMLDASNPSFADENELTGLSYDQLAGGERTSRRVDENEKPAGTRKSVKTFVVLALGLGMLGILVLATTLMHMQYSLAVSQAALVGNYLPINTKTDGEIAEVFFTEGQQVKQGDVLLRLTNPIIESAAALRHAELEAAQAEVEALKQQIADFQAKLDLVSKKLALDLATSQAELLQAEQNLKIASAEVERFAPFVKSGAITQVEFDQARNTELACKALCNAKQAQIKSVELSQLATKQNILLLGDRIDDPLSELHTKLKIAEAEVERLKLELHYAEQQAKQLEIVAPHDGTIYANYRQVGEYLKPAEEAMALSTSGRAWAMGQISASQVAKVRPGQMVHVAIPSLDLTTTGAVTAVGHRAVYTRGGYTADFRSGVASDVPIKVMLDDLPPGVPSGIRLDMVVKLEIGIPWLDRYLGNTPRPTGMASSAPIQSAPNQETLVPEIVQTAGFTGP